MLTTQKNSLFCQSHNLAPAPKMGYFGGSPKFSNVNPYSKEIEWHKPEVDITPLTKMAAILKFEIGKQTKSGHSKTTF
jgi:hypothetical protein